MLAFFGLGKRKQAFEEKKAKAQALDQNTINFAFEPTQADFATAQQMLADTPSGTKLSRKTSELKYSFIKADDKIYAMSNKHCYTIKHGGFGMFKIGMSEDKKLVGIKIEPRERRNPDEPGLIAAKRMGLFIAQAQRNDTDMLFPYASEVCDVFNKTHVENKLYSIVKLGGDDLTKIELPLTETQRQLLSLKLCDLTNRMHKMGIIHGDINPGNILVTMDGNQIEVDLIDFDFSKIVVPPQTSMTERGRAFGMPPYTAPETQRSKMYSFASDIYALGMVLFFDLNRSVNCYKKEFVNTLNQSWTLPTYFLFTKDKDVYNVLPDKEIINEMTQMSAERITLDVAIRYFSEKLLANSEIQADPRLLAQVKAIQARTSGQQQEVNPNEQVKPLEPALPVKDVKLSRKRR